MSKKVVNPPAISCRANSVYNHIYLEEDAQFYPMQFNI